jgi:hypothetical protein
MSEERTYYGPPHAKRPYDPTRCREAIWQPRAWGSSQCSKAAKRDGWCAIHHPDAKAARRNASVERYEEQQAKEKRQRIKWALDDLKEMGLSASAQHEIQEILRGASA